MDVTLPLEWYICPRSYTNRVTLAQKFDGRKVATPVVYSYSVTFYHARIFRHVYNIALNLLLSAAHLIHDFAYVALVCGEKSGSPSLYGLALPSLLLCVTHTFTYFIFRTQVILFRQTCYTFKFRPL